MGKKRAQKDRGYITAKEHKEEWGGFKDKSVRGPAVARRAGGGACSAVAQRSGTANAAGHRSSVCRFHERRARCIL